MMNTRRILASLLIALVVCVLPASAANGVGAITITGGSLLQCTGGIIEAAYSITATNEGGSTLASVAVTQQFTLSNGTVLPLAATLTTGSSHTIYLAGAGSVNYVEIVLVAAADPSVTSNTARIWCDGTVELSGSSKGGDGRINWSNGDLINALYATRDAAGRGTVTVYLIDSKSMGTKIGTFEYDLFAPYLETPPAENTFLGQVSYSRLYAITSGEFQIIIDDPVEKKTYTTIFSAFPITNVYW